MKVEMDNRGALSIEAETGVERYALKKRCEESIDRDGSIKDGPWCFYCGEQR